MTRTNYAVPTQLPNYLARWNNTRPLEVSQAEEAANISLSNGVRPLCTCAKCNAIRDRELLARRMR